MSIKLYKDSLRAQNIKNFNLATMDLSNAVAGEDYIIAGNGPQVGTLPTTGETLKQIKIHVPLRGMNFISGYIDDPYSEENLILPNKIGLVHTEITPPEQEGDDPTIVNYYGIEDAEAIPVGEKPNDWDLHWIDKYLLRTTTGQFYLYRQQGINPEQWDSTAQYYRVPDLVNMYYTDATGSFGVSRVVYPTGGNHWDELVRVLYSTTRPLNSSDHVGYWWWKVGGISGTNLFFADNYDFVHDYSLALDYHYTFSTYDELVNYESYLLCQMIRFELGEDEYTGIMILKMGADYVPVEADIVALSAPFWKEEYTPSEGGPKSHTKGGHGSFSAPSNNRGDRNGAYVQNVVNGWQTAAAPYTSSFNKYCFGSGDETILQDALQEIYNPDWWDSIKSLVQKPTDGILQIHAMPNQLGPSKNGLTDYVRVGYRKLTDEANAPLFTDIYTKFHMGNIYVDQYFDGYPDLNNTTIQIHLPYIGTQNLDVSAVIGGELAVEYTTDVMTGDCIAWVWCKDRDGNYNYRYTWKGNCAKQLNLQMAPMNPVIGLTAKAAPLAMGIATGTVAGTIAGIGAAMRNAAQVASNISQFNQGYGSFSPMAMAQSWGDNWLLDGTSSIGSTAAIGATNMGASVMQSVKGMPSLGSSNVTSSNADSCGTVTAPADTTCYLIITRPVWSNPEGYENMFGLPSDIGGTIANDFTGFLSCRTIKLDGVDATDVEKTEIANIMASGVFV